jgi:maltoporin
VALTKINDAGMPAGSVLQVASNFITSDFNTASTSFVTTGLAQAITPLSTSSKILCIVSIGSWYIGGSGGSGNATVYRGSTNIGNGTAGLAHIGVPGLNIPSTLQEQLTLCMLEQAV